MKSFNCYIMWFIPLFFLGRVSLNNVKEIGTRVICDSSSANDSMLEGPVCESIIIKNITDIRKLCGCKMIDGNLQLNDFIGTDDSINGLSFPLLREIRGWLLIYKISQELILKDLFPNLLLVRGENLITKYAIVVLKVTGPMDDFFPSLHYVQNGLIYLKDADHYPTDHPCKRTYASSIIVQQKNSSFHFLANLSNAFDSSCSERCPSNCDKVGVCCHAQCLGGCSAPDDPEACFICANVLQGNSCRATCSHDYYQVNHRCVKKQFCVDKNLLIFNDTQKCLIDENCPTDYQFSSPNVCSRCPKNKKCPKKCPGQKIDCLDDTFNVTGCEIIEGSLTINIGDDCLILDQLESSLSNVREVKDYIRISRTYLKSLQFLKGIRRIGGEKLFRNRFAFLVEENVLLESTVEFDVQNHQIQIDRGDVRFENNDRLCPESIWKFVDHCQGSNITRLEQLSKLSPIEVAEEGRDVTSKGISHIDLLIDQLTMTNRSNGIVGSCRCANYCRRRSINESIYM